MATPIIMPRQGQSVESCIISKWYKKKGDKVNVGDVLFTYETDKATFDEESKVEGIMLDIFFEEGDDVPCLLNVCVVGNDGESTSEFNPNGAPAEKAEEPVKVEAAQAASVEVVQTAATQAPPVIVNEGERVKISPRARNLADKTGIDYRYATPTGPDGRIIERDIITLQQNGPVFTSAAKSEAAGTVPGAVTGTGIGGRVTTADLAASKAPETVSTPAATVVTAQAGPLYREEKLSNIRKVIAKAMHNSITSTCQLTLNSSFDATEILAYRKKLKDGKDKMGLANITLNDIILYAVSRTLKQHENLNAHFLDDKMHIFNNVHLGVAVDTDRGLMVPNVMFADLKSLNDISKEVKVLADQCQKGTISPDSLKGGSFTISNLGTLDIESFTPVLNAPQVGILGVNTIVQRAREVGDEIEFYPAMALSLTFDHRAVDGAPAGKFLKDLKANLENFTALLSK